MVEPPTPLKNDGVKVSWDDDIPKIWKNMVQTTNQLYFQLSMFDDCYCFFHLISNNEDPEIKRCRSAISIYSCWVQRETLL